MKELLNNLLLLGLAVLFLYGLFASGRFFYRNYLDKQDRQNGLNRFLSGLPALGFQRLAADSVEVRQVMAGYFLPRGTGRSLGVIKALSAFKTDLGSSPAFVLLTYEKINDFGAPIGAGRHATRSEFQGTLVAARLSLNFAGQTIIYQRPPSDDDDIWFWSADTPLLGPRSLLIEHGLTADFRKEFTVRSTTPSATLSPPIQELLLKNRALFNNTSDHRSALVVDGLGWGFGSDIITDQAILDDLMLFQKELTRQLKDLPAGT